MGVRDGCTIVAVFEKEIPHNIRYAITIRQRTRVVHGGDVKRFLWVTPMLFVLMLGSAFADSTIFLIPNDGSGDNFGFLQRGGGVIIGIHGGTAVDFFNVFGYAPGSTLGGFSTEVFNSGSFAQFGGNSFELAFSGPATLFMSSFTLPTNGKDFTAQVELDFSASVFILLDTGPGQPFGVGGGATPVS